ncbi:cation-dependent mannose-6-phosphate receptor [Eucyclogobius newberryi]|uniref:cation-dependent mannose-6-phosphate receptor n=1 Tax=Eucyclogobius newberryi TaxID=166745 RepID=UPI003B597D0F
MQPRDPMKARRGLGGGRVLSLVPLLVLLLVLCGCSAEDGMDKCKLTAESASERSVLNRLTPLLHRNFSVVQKEEKESYTYVFQLCGDADGVAGAGFVQKDNTKTTVVGRYNSTKAIGGSVWVLLTYDNGEKYDNHCDMANRKAFVMITCDRTTDASTLTVAEERERKECFYLFEMTSSAVCPPLESKLSAGSILLIVGLCLVAAYLIGGFLYQRLIVGAKGMDQIPNYAFWVEIGNLSADGCDFVCRSKNREEPNAYRGVSSEPAEEEPEERDDHLLPM